MTRIRRPLIAAVAATAVTASMGVGASQSAAAGCEYSAWKIIKRENVTCRKAKKVLKGDARIGGGEKVPGWSCSYGDTIIPEGKCRKGNSRSFKYKPK